MKFDLFRMRIYVWYIINVKNLYIERQKILSEYNEEYVEISGSSCIGNGISFFAKLKTLTKITRNTFKVLFISVRK